MKFVADENFPRSSVDLLRAAGHEVIFVAEVLGGASDREVVELARKDAPC